MKRDAVPGTAEDLRELVREAHGVIKDLRLAMADARRMHREAAEKALEDVGETLASANSVIQERLDQWTVELSRVTPLTVLCGQCGAVSAVAATLGKKHHCSGCGLEFAVLGSVRIDDGSEVGIRNVNVLAPAAAGQVRTGSRPGREPASPGGGHAI